MSRFERWIGDTMTRPGGHVLGAVDLEAEPEPGDDHDEGPGRRRRYQRCRGVMTSPLLVALGDVELAPGSSEPLQDRVDDLVDGEVAGVDHQGLVGLAQRVVGPPLVEGVAAGEVGGDGLVVRGRRPPSSAGPPAPPAEASRYTLRAASGNTTVPMSRPSITPPPRSAAHSRWRRRISARTVGLAATMLTARVTSGSADLDGGVHAVDHDGAVGGRRRAPCPRPGWPPPPASSGSTPGPQGGEGHRAVHGPGVEVRQPDALGHGPGDGGLARPGRSVDGDHPGLIGHGALLGRMVSRTSK